MYTIDAVEVRVSVVAVIVGMLVLEDVTRSVLIFITVVVVAVAIVLELRVRVPVVTVVDNGWVDEVVAVV